ncbi:HPr kinase/phosphorylase [Stakelama saccharophila]|uniref:HPr kinase/phosphatase C-terminal domain-containing protein n=1 Tax=Stakelama saccharophila TaxID=3075605 RepID=A0ABZ0B526_9SPHN|nr:HPr kinase/phosphatase C-terminal domain-containing protein [Stakelama sp. W311]WNO52490.1 HPr kinase/phosphatase C-terminal domain-containing protein [Stakelama sp. W311]
MTELSSETLHATCVAIGGLAVLIEGRSGSGKSDLALRLIDRGASLVSDDYTLVTRRAGTPIASSPSTIAGKMEVRGIGVVTVEASEPAPVALIVEIEDSPPRMPSGRTTRRIAGVEIPVGAVAALEPSAPIKVEMMLRSLGATD